MKKILFGADIPSISNEENFESQIIKFKFDMENYKNELSEINLPENIIDKFNFKKVVKNILNKHSTKLTNQIENEDVDSLEIDESFLSSSYKNKLISNSIFKMYMNYELNMNDFDLKEFKGIHKNLFNSQKDYRPGSVRRRNVKVGDIELIDFEKLNKWLNRFLVYFNQKDNKREPIVKSAMIHLLCVAIHPFIDGNGRFSRFLSDKYFSANYKIPFSVNQAIAENGLTNYYKNLNYFFKNLDPTPFINYIFEMTSNQFRFNIKAIKDYSINVSKIFERLKKLDLKNDYTKLLSYEFSLNPLFSISRLERILEVTTMTARNVFKILKDNGFTKDYKKIGNQNVVRFVWWKN